MSLQVIVRCPRCGKEWSVNQGEPEIDCNCHTYCEEGSKPSDCNLTPYTFNHEAGAPYGAHVGSITADDDPVHIQYYCSVHSRYGYKTAISIPVDWSRELHGRSKFRWTQKP